MNQTCGWLGADPQLLLEKNKSTHDDRSVDSPLWMNFHRRETVSHGQSYTFTLCDFAYIAEIFLAINVKWLKKDLKMLNHSKKIWKLLKKKKPNKFRRAFWSSQTTKKTLTPRKTSRELWKLKLSNLSPSDFVGCLLCSDHYSFNFLFILNYPKFYLSLCFYMNTLEWGMKICFY